MDRSEMKTVAERIEDAMREIGVLLLAFAPLDVALNRHEEGNIGFLLLFLGLGTSLFSGALLLEGKRRGAPDANARVLLIFALVGAILMTAALALGRGA